MSPFLMLHLLCKYALPCHLDVELAYYLLKLQPGTRVRIATVHL